MEVVLLTQSDNITSLEQNVVELHSKLNSITEENGALRATVEDLVYRSKHQNLRVIGLPEDTEGKNPRKFMADLFKEVAAGALLNSTPKPKPHQESCPVIVRFHRYAYRGHNIKFYKDFSAVVAKRQAAFNHVKSLL